MQKTFLAVSLLWASVLQATPGQIHYVEPLQAEIKEAPSAKSSTKFIIAVGRKVVEFDRKGRWVLVGIDRSGGRDGWVNIDDLSPTDPDGIRY